MQIKQLEIYYAPAEVEEGKYHFQRSCKSKFSVGRKKYITFAEVCGALDYTPANTFP